MKNRVSLLSICAFSLLLLSAVTVSLGTASAAHGDELPRVLIIGDSISMGYTPSVQKMLADEAMVMRPYRVGKDGKPARENCAGTTHGVASIDRWLKLEGGKWDIIHFNFGLHDLKRVSGEGKKNSNDPKDLRQAEPDLYRKQLTEIVGKLKATGATLIFATTTPVPPGKVRPHRDVTDPARYNGIALEIMKKNDIAINDLYTLANENQKEWMLPANVHFKPAGSQGLAKQVATTLRETLSK